MKKALRDFLFRCKRMAQYANRWDFWSVYWHWHYAQDDVKAGYNMIRDNRRLSYILPFKVKKP